MQLGAKKEKYRIMTTAISIKQTKLAIENLQKTDADVGNYNWSAYNMQTFSLRMQSTSARLCLNRCKCTATKLIIGIAKTTVCLQMHNRVGV